MPDNLSYLNDSVKIYYTFKNSQRRYCNPDAFAAFIGALAETGKWDHVYVHGAAIRVFHIQIVIV